MFAAAVLLATYTTFGPIAQDEQSLYYVTTSNHEIRRVSKDDPNAWVGLVSSEHVIGALDRDGNDLYYATASAQDCTTRPAFGPDNPYRTTTCALTDTAPQHVIVRVPLAGGPPRVLVRGFRGTREILHDGSWIYFIEPSTPNGRDGLLDARLRRVDKSGLIVETILDGFVMPYSNQHPFVLLGENIYINAGGLVLRIAKSGGPMTQIAPSYPEAPLSTDGQRVFFGLGVAPGMVVTETRGGSTGHATREWALEPACSRAELRAPLALEIGDRFDGYFIDPLSAPPIAIDDRGVYLRDRRVIVFATPPEHCSRTRVARH